MITRPTDWNYASPDGSILLTGFLVGEPVEGAEFLLSSLWIEHPSLVRTIESGVSISGSPLQTLHSINSNSAVFSLQSTLDPSTTNSIILHFPLHTPTSLATVVQQSPELWSSTFQILLDGPGFALPRWNFEERSTDSIGPTSSPLQRALLSPLISPLLTNRRSSIPSDISIPNLVLGVSRSSISKAPIPMPVAPPSTLSLLLAPALSTRPNLEEIHNINLSQKTTATAEEIMVIRRRHELFVRRTKTEFELLEARKAGAVNNTSGAGMKVKGFGKDPQENGRRTSSRENSKDREESKERGRKSREDDGIISQRLLRQSEGSREEALEETRELEEASRGRSRSRTGRTPEIALVELPIETLDDFVPSSHQLLSIPESEELLSPGPSTPTVNLVEEEVELDTPFEMDEDIDSEFEEETGSPFTLEVELPTSPLLQPSSFRAGSYRAGNSNLSSSYAQLLSISNQKSPNRTPISLPAYVPNRPSINAHSHRGRHDDLLAPDEDDYEENYESESDAPANAGNQYAVGSLPISISALQPRTFSNTTFDGNGRKIDKVIGSSSYRPPLPPPVQSGGEFGTAMAPLSVSKSSLFPSSFVGPSSLAQSLNNRTGRGQSFATMTSTKVDAVGPLQETTKNARVEPFIPPHLFNQKLSVQGEELLSRSVPRN